MLPTSGRKNSIFSHIQKYKKCYCQRNKMRKFPLILGGLNIGGRTRFQRRKPLTFVQFSSWRMYWFSRTATANEHRPSALKQQKFVLSQVWMLEAEFRVLDGLCSSQSLQGRILPCLFYLLVIAGEPLLSWLMATQLQFLSSSLHASPHSFCVDILSPCKNSSGGIKPTQPSMTSS